MRLKVIFWVVLGSFIFSACSQVHFFTSNSDAIFKYNRATGELSIYWKWDVEHMTIPIDTGKFVRVKNVEADSVWQVKD